MFLINSLFVSLQNISVQRIYRQLENKVTGLWCASTRWQGESGGQEGGRGGGTGARLWASSIPRRAENSCESFMSVKTREISRLGEIKIWGHCQDFQLAFPGKIPPNSKALLFIPYWGLGEWLLLHKQPKAPFSQEKVWRKNARS